MLITMIASVIAAAVLFAFPQALFPNSSVNGMDRLLPLIILAVAGSDVALAACAYRYDLAATGGARSIVDTWTYSHVPSCAVRRLGEECGVLGCYRRVTEP